MPPDRYAVGIDLGGSKLRGGLVSLSGQLVGRLEVQTEPWKGPAGVLANLKGMISRLVDSTEPARVAGIGIAAAGQIHPKTQAVGVFVGTGVGSGAVVDGILLQGAGNAAGELGHTQVVPDGLPCACGRHGCVEAYASGRGFARRLEAALAEGIETRLASETGGDPSRVTTALVARAAAAGDAFAEAIWGDAERYLGQAIGNYVTLLNPELLVLGGGVMTTVPGLAPALEREVRAHATVLSRDVRIARAGLGDSSAIFGAADRVWGHV